ncbi:uncharacterized protein LOC133382945 [Rhineura floridana]|uniref:uncharacterized protein LOC133382945 n=1 Tax=Rhineura floridana TaxID=261503 RepID=UPI002AC80761|nr:uncharacterized protein LOC133382945 [Rhineura floridana]XP_061478636.1 uncharacterized protein LOC133382945 [Rhineura floridana]
MELVEKLLCRMLFLFFMIQSGIGRTQQTFMPPGFIESTCFSSIFWVKLDKFFLQDKFFIVEIIDPSGVLILLEKKLEARCGYVLSNDVWGNTIFRASFLGCHVINEMDEKFFLSINIKVSLFQDMRAATTYQHPMRCSYIPWAPREILCEDNYMEVSVKSDVPVISDDETAEWMSALPEAQKVVYQIWQLMFYSPSGRKTTVVSAADKLGYSFNNTLARVFLRSPYSTNETERSVVNGVTMSTVSSTSMYKQRWLLLLIDTTVSCPIDGTSFTDTAIIWTVPSIIPRLVLQEATFTSLRISMAVDGQRIENPEKFNYILQRNNTHIGITIPIGASGGRLKSTVFNGVHGVTYSIDLLLEHTWTDTDWHLTKYTVIKPITTPFMPRIPRVVNNTVPETRLFDVTLGVFLPDVTLLALKIGEEPLSYMEAEQKGYKISDTPFPNGTVGFNLVVPFDDRNVLKEYVNKNETKYHLHVNYILNVGPELKLYDHPADIECIIADVELPEGIGYCDKENMYLAVPIVGLYQYWSLYVGNKPLSQATTLADGYLVTTNATHLVLQVPLFTVGIIYEEVSFERIQARFDLVLKKTNTLEILDIFSVRCSFHPSQFIVCYPNGTIAVSALMKTVPAIDMGKTRLKDSTCKPKEFTQEQAFFQFHVSTCGTSLRFEDEHLIYENEISFDKETLPEQGPPTITRDPAYRLTLLCYYPIKETLMQSAMFYGSSSSSRPPLPFGYGTMMTRSNVASLRRARQVLNILSNVFKDESFTELYGPHSAAVRCSREPIFLEVELKDEAPDVELYLDNCWMSGTEEFRSIPQWNIITDGCKNKSSRSVSFFPVTKSDRVKYPQHFKRLRIWILTPSLREVYFHCTVIAGTCFHLPGNGLPCKQCSSGRKLDQHSEIHPNHHGYVVVGPVLIHPGQIK